MKADKLKTCAESTIISTVVWYPEHYPVWQTKFVICVKSTLNIGELLWPVRKVYEFVVLTLAAIFN